MRDMDAQQKTAVNQIGRPNDISTYGLFLVVFAPVDVGGSSDPSRIDDMCRLNSLEVTASSRAVSGLLMEIKTKT